MGKRYAYQRKNIALEPIKRLLNKIVIICYGDYKYSKLEELVNIGRKSRFYKNVKHHKIATQFDPIKIIKYNRKNLTCVYPNFKGRRTCNYNPKFAFKSGCQFILLNFLKQISSSFFYKFNLSVWISNKLFICSCVISSIEIGFHKGLLFFITKTELGRSIQEKGNYRLYRLYNYDGENDNFDLAIIKGELSGYCNFPETYKIRVNND